MWHGRLRVAVCQYGVEQLESWQAFVRKQERLVVEAAGTGAELLVFPEYLSLELAGWMPASVRGDVGRQIEQIQAYRDDYVELYRRLALRHDLTIVVGSFPLLYENGCVRNRAWVVGPQGEVCFQEKLLMTRFESELWGVEPGTEMKVFEASWGRFAVAICYDSEFPLACRAAVEAGAQILVVPSCTDSAYGYHRVRVGSQARALENQCFVLQSPLVGNAPWSAAIDVNVGMAGVYGPIEPGFAEDGVLATGAWNAPSWLTASLDLGQLERVRHRGEVLNHRDWHHQLALGASPVRVVKL